MHYIRFLKVPRLSLTKPSQRTITSKITITTDLGESFLAKNINIEVFLSHSSGSTKPVPYTWTGETGVRALEISVPVPRTWRGNVKMKVKATGGIDVETFFDVLNERGIVGVRSMDLDLEGNDMATEPLAERRFGDVSVWEETGESIARHIWDAGLVLSAYITQLSSPPKKLSRLPTLDNILNNKSLNILELGAGCGIVGITFAKSLPNIETFILTDLPEASEILARNLVPLTSSSNTKPSISHQVLDWSCPLPGNISGLNWDLVLVADCTYNPDVVPDLVSTLGKVREGSKQVLVLLAMKVRHESEMVFFDLMREQGWVVKERKGIGLPTLDWDEDEGEVIEIFVFGQER